MFSFKQSNDFYSTVHKSVTSASFNRDEITVHANTAEVVNFDFVVKVSTCVCVSNVARQLLFRLATTLSLRRDRGSINYRNTQHPRANKTSISFQQWCFLPWQCWNITPSRLLFLSSHSPAADLGPFPFTCFLCFLFKSPHPFSPNW